MIQKAVCINRTEQRKHSLPIVVHIIAVEIGVRITNGVEWRTGRTNLEKTFRSDRFSYHRQPRSIIRDEVDLGIMQTRRVDRRRVLGQGMLSVELVVIKTPLVQRLKNALNNPQRLWIAGIKRGGAVIANHSSFLVVEIPIRMCA